MDDSMNELGKESTPPDPTGSKPINVEKLDADTLMGYVTLSAYFGYSIEKAFDRILDPAVEKIFNDLASYFKNQ